MPLVLLRDGSNAPPFFITHGLGGRVTELSRIVESLDTDGPVYGLQWRGWNGQEPPQDSIHEMAAYFLDAIVAVFPQGPYVLAGLSIGVMMLEVARQLAKRECNVARLAFLDTYPHPRYWPIGCWVGTMTRRAMHHGSIVMKLPLKDVILELNSKARGFRSHLRSRRNPSVEVETFMGGGASVALQRMPRQALSAFFSYKPEYYAEKSTFLKADSPNRFPKNASKIWGNLASDFEVHKIPCDYAAMISTHAKSSQNLPF